MSANDPLRTSAELLGPPVLRVFITQDCTLGPYRVEASDDDIVSLHFNVDPLYAEDPQGRHWPAQHGREQHLVGIKPLGRRSIPIAEALDVFLLGAMDATEEWCRLLDPSAMIRQPQ